MIEENQWIKKFITASQVQTINKKIKTIECHTSAEIVIVIVDRSIATDHLRFSLFLLVNVFLLIIYIFWSGWAFGLANTDLFFYLIPILSLIFSFCLFPLSFIKRILTPKSDQNSQVIAKSELEFYRQKINSTRSKTGILIYLSLLERRAVVLADKTISEKFPENTWSDIVDIIVKGIDKKNIAQGLLDGLEDCQTRLAENFPIEPNDTNELPNEVVIKTFS